MSSFKIQGIQSLLAPGLQRHWRKPASCQKVLQKGLLKCTYAAVWWSFRQ